MILWMDGTLQVLAIVLGEAHRHVHTYTYKCIYVVYVCVYMYYIMCVYHLGAAGTHVPWQQAREVDGKVAARGRCGHVAARGRRGEVAARGGGEGRWLPGGG